MSATQISPSPQAPASGLPRALQQAGLLTAQQIDTLTRSAATEKIFFIDALVKSDMIQSLALAQFCSSTFACPLLDLSAVNLQ